MNILSDKLLFKRRITVSDFVYILQKAEGHQLGDRKVLGRNLATFCNETQGPAERLFHGSIISQVEP